ncbi:ATP-binding cassette domain-containing protein [Kocuria sp.]|uniref:ATP-binding cassette domain-containing protein n=1 Tax=Kocuria sp. TaxID=1871328 RepID=UPI0026DF408F|nr:ABC transporter ATP-binding protein [Kocuria sp.]MDO5618822.1 ABC transporter ATP-binding protein [Kocuria sp.]
MSGTNIPAVTTRGLTKKFGTHPAITDVTLTLGSGTIHALIGPSGSGKTTLLNLVAGLAQPSSGSVHLFGVDHGVRPGLDQRRRIGALIGDHPIMDHLTAVENLTYHRTLRGLAQRGLEDRLLNQVGLADHGTGGTAQRRKMRNCSPSIRQRVALATAWMGAPQLVLLDDPLAALDAPEADRVKGVMTTLAQEHGTAVVIADRDIGPWRNAATQFILLADGEVQDVLNSVDLLRTTGRFLRIVSEQTPAVVRVLQEELDLTDHAILPDDAVRVRLGDLQSSVVLKTLAAHDLWPSSFTEESIPWTSSSPTTHHTPGRQA